MTNLTTYATRVNRAWATLALQGAAAAVLVWALLGGHWLGSADPPRVWVLVDRSQSMPVDKSKQAVAEVLRAAQATGAATPQVLEFAGRVAALGGDSLQGGGTARAGDSTGAGSPDLHLDPSTTHIEAALLAALAAHAQQPLAGVVLVSDGLANAGNTLRALQVAQEARLPVRWLALGQPAPDAFIKQVLAPARAQQGQRLQVVVQVQVQVSLPVPMSAQMPTQAGGQQPLAEAYKKAFQVQATSRSVAGVTQKVSGNVSANGQALLDLDTVATGALVVDLALRDSRTGQLVHTMADAAVVDVLPAAPVLVVHGQHAAHEPARPHGAVAQSLQRGGWPLQVVAAADLDTQTDTLHGLQAVVLDDVAITDASPRFWATLTAAVKERGLGLLVLGGERSFARGGYRGSALESVLPVLSEAAVLDEPVAVVFAVDKSGSMGQGSGGINRFALAQRAVLETARGLAPRDALGLVVFDVAPRVLVPLGAADAGTAALARDWPVSPNGGTQVAPALDVAIGELERSTAARRLLVLVTDGFVDAAPAAALQARLRRAGIETIALAVGPDADVVALQRVIGAASGQVLRVDQAANLPAVMRTGVERRRARVERGSIAVQQLRPLPFAFSAALASSASAASAASAAPGTLFNWPSIAAHHATRPQPGAVVVVHSARGEPVVAYQTVGRGRVVAVTSGLGPWTPQWLAWHEWPRLVGGLTDWVSGAATAAAGAGLGATGALSFSEGAAGLQLEFDAPSAGLAADGPADGPGARAGDAPAWSVTADTPTAQGLVLALQRVAPGRLRATLPEPAPGLHTFTVSTPQGTQRHLHLRRRMVENNEHGVGGLNPALATWRAAGLISAWHPGPWVAPPDIAAQQRVDRSLLCLALLLFAAAVLLDRLGVPSLPSLTSLSGGRGRKTPGQSGLAGP